MYLFYSVSEINISPNIVMSPNVKAYPDMSFNMYAFMCFDVSIKVYFEL